MLKPNARTAQQTFVSPETLQMDNSLLYFCVLKLIQLNVEEQPCLTYIPEVTLSFKPHSQITVNTVSTMFIEEAMTSQHGILI